MEHTATFLFLVPANTRSFHDDNWQKTDVAYVDTWKSAVNLLRERKISFEDVSYVVSFDWTPLLRCHERHYSAMEYIYRAGRDDVGRRVMRARFPRRPSKILVTARTNATKGQKKLQSVAESVIHDVFLIMNIAAPGCCNFYRATLVGEETTTEISLSSSEFELCVLPSRRRQIAAFISRNKVVSWYESVRPSVGQVPASPTERTMFALLHLAKPDTEMLSVVWLFYALESLLQTKVGENFGSIVRRLTLLLGLAKNEIVSMKKQMRALYDLRSAIVHGGFQTIHPMQNELLDRRVDKAFGRLLDAIEYGLFIVIAAVQKMADANWSQLTFDEIIVTREPVAGFHEVE